MAGLLVYLAVSVAARGFVLVVGGIVRWARVRGRERPPDQWRLAADERPLGKRSG